MLHNFLEVGISLKTVHVGGHHIMTEGIVSLGNIHSQYHYHIASRVTQLAGGGGDIQRQKRGQLAGCGQT